MNGSILLNHTINIMCIRDNNEYFVADSINEFDMMICNQLHRERSLSDMSDLSDDPVITQMNQVKEEEEEKENCCICFEPMNLKKNYCVTPCGHAFCFICIVKTMAKQNSCPCCRASLYQEEHIQSAVIEEYDENSVMNESLSSNLIIEQDRVQPNHQNDLNEMYRNVPPLQFNDTEEENVRWFEFRLNQRSRVNLLHEFDNAANIPERNGGMMSEDGSVPPWVQIPEQGLPPYYYRDRADALRMHISPDDTLLSEVSDNEMEISTDVSVELPTYISQNSQEYALEQWPPLTEVEPDSLETDEPSEEIDTSVILPSSMDNHNQFGNSSIFMIHSRMRQEGYTMLDVLIITLLMMFPQEIREDLQTYQCAQGLKTIIRDMQNETKEKMLFAMEDRNVM